MVDGATILSVDDDEDLRQLVGDVLTGAGFRVLSADSAESALLVLESDEPIDLIVTDVVMPGLNGMALARLARRLRPDVRILYSSAFWPHIVTEPADRDLVRKPYLPKQLIDRVRRSLSAAPCQTPD
jgi:two-component system cell cycle sensor histidine kinase/response regulator CckA